MFFPKFPSTKLQDVNLDWLLKKICKLRGGTTNQVLAKASNADFDFKWVTGGGGGGTSDYNDLVNQPQINNVTLIGNLSASDLGLLDPAALTPYRTAADQDVIDAAKQAKITASGMLKGDGDGGVTAAAAGTDYLAPAALTPYRTADAQDTIDAAKQAKITASGMLKGDGDGGVTAATAGTDYLAPAALMPYRTAAAQDAIDEGLVSAVAAQSFSETQQVQARNNIGAIDAGSIATIESSPVTQAHAVGDYIVYNGQLYKVTATIAQGESLVSGTNVSATKIAENLPIVSQISGSDLLYLDTSLCEIMDNTTSIYKYGNIINGTIVLHTKVLIPNGTGTPVLALPNGYRPPNGQFIPAYVTHGLWNTYSETSALAYMATNGNIVLNWSADIPQDRYVKLMFTFYAN